MNLDLFFLFVTLSISLFSHCLESMEPLKSWIFLIFTFVPFMLPYVLNYHRHLTVGQPYERFLSRRSPDGLFTKFCYRSVVSAVIDPSILVIDPGILVSLVRLFSATPNGKA